MALFRTVIDGMYYWVKRYCNVFQAQVVILSIMKNYSIQELQLLQNILNYKMTVIILDN